MEFVTNSDLIAHLLIIQNGYCQHPPSYSHAESHLHTDQSMCFPSKGSGLLSIWIKLSKAYCEYDGESHQGNQGHYYHHDALLTLLGTIRHFLQKDKDTNIMEINGTHLK